MKLLIYILGVVSVVAVAVAMFVPASTKWMVNNGTMSLTMTEANGRFWSVEDLPVADVLTESFGNTCAAPFSGKVLLVSEPFVDQGVSRVAVLSLRGSGRGYQVDYVGWMGIRGDIDPIRVRDAILGDALMNPNWTASFILGLTEQRAIRGADISYNSWVLEGSTSASGAGMAGPVDIVFPQTGGLSQSRIRASAMGVGSIEAQVDARWQAVDDTLMLGLFRPFC